MTGADRAETIVASCAGSLTGKAGADWLDGGDGGDGNDRLGGGRGKDGFKAGNGRDFADAVDGVRETVDCGAGKDSAEVDRKDVVKGCERVKRF